MNMFFFYSRTSHLLQHAEPAQEGAAAAAEVLQGAGLGHCRQSEDHCLPSGIQPYSFLHCIISQLIFYSLLAIRVTLPTTYQYEVVKGATYPSPSMCVPIEEYAHLSLESGVGAHRPHSGVCPAYPSGVSRGERKKVF